MGHGPSPPLVTWLPGGGVTSVVAIGRVAPLERHRELGVGLVAVGDEAVVDVLSRGLGDQSELLAERVQRQAHAPRKRGFRAARSIGWRNLVDHRP